MLEVIDHSELISPELLRVYNPVMQQLVIYAISANPLKCQKFVYWPSRDSLEQVKRRPGTTDRHVFVEGNFTPLLSLTNERAQQSRRHKSIRDSVYGMLVALLRVKLNPRPLKKKKKRWRDRYPLAKIRLQRLWMGKPSHKTVRRICPKEEEDRGGSGELL
jgi:hypothetical protein